MKKPITWNFIFLFIPWTRLFRALKVTSTVKSFLSCNTHRSIDLFLENFSAKAPAHSVCHFCVAELTLGVFTLLNCLKPLRFTILLTDIWPILVTFSISRGEKWVQVFSSCEQIKSPTRSSFSSVVTVTGLPDPSRQSMEPSFSNLFNSLWRDTLLRFLLGYSWQILYRDQPFPTKSFLIIALSSLEKTMTFTNTQLHCV